MDAAFIHDKLEIKFLILYIAARISEPIPMDGMQELTLCDSGIDYFSFSEYCTRVSEEKKHEKYMEEQHKQESIITANQRSLDMHKKELMRDGMISIEALVKITNMLQQNPEVQDLFITLATLPDSKRQHAINALNTLITSLS